MKTIINILFWWAFYFSIIWVIGWSVISFTDLQAADPISVLRNLEYSTEHERKSFVSVFILWLIGAYIPTHVTRLFRGGSL